MIENGEAVQSTGWCRRLFEFESTIITRGTVLVHGWTIFIKRQLHLLNKYPLFSRYLNLLNGGSTWASQPAQMKFRITISPSIKLPPARLSHNSFTETLVVRSFPTWTSFWTFHHSIYYVTWRLGFPIRRKATGKSSQSLNFARTSACKSVHILFFEATYSSSSCSSNLLVWPSVGLLLTWACARGSNWRRKKVVSRPRCIRHWHDRNCKRRDGEINVEQHTYGVHGILAPAAVVLRAGCRRGDWTRRTG